MSLKAFYKIDQDSTGTPVEYKGARYIEHYDETHLKSVLAADYRVPVSAVQIESVVAHDVES